MNFKKLIGQTFFEKEFYELLLFDIEEYFDKKYSEKYLNIYFDNLPDQRIRINEVVYFKDSDEMNQVDRKCIEKRQWFQISERFGTFILLLIRLDRTGTLSRVYSDRTCTEDWCHGWADEEPEHEPLTRDEIRQAFQEMCGYFENQQEVQKLKSKKAV